MTVRHVRRFLPALVLLLAAPVILTGCSKSAKTKPIPRPTITHRDADDIAQVLATTVSADNGGWYAVVKVLGESLSVPAPNLRSLPAAPAFAMPLSRITQPANAFAFTKAGVTWNLRVGYWRTDNTVWASRDTASDYLEAYVGADEGVINGNGLVGDYGFHASTTFDSSLTVFGLAASSDTLEFSAVADDSCFAIVTSTIPDNGTNGRYWFHQNFFDCDFKILKANLPASPYPAYGEVNWVIEAFPLATPGRTDYALHTDILTEARMTFDGTQFGSLTISDTIIDPAYVYTYKVNLNTGAIQRTN